MLVGVSSSVAKSLMRNRSAQKISHNGAGRKALHLILHLGNLEFKIDYSRNACVYSRSRILLSHDT